MTGNEFVEKVLAVPQYKKLYDENLYFHDQILFIKRKNEVHTPALIDAIAYQSRQLLTKDLEMIKQADQRMLTEEDMMI